MNTTSALGVSSAPRQVALVVGASLVLAISAWISVPMWPVPITLQSLAVGAIALVLGRRLGTAAVLAYLAEGASGLPVFAGGASGIHAFVGPTGGYLAGFVLAAWLVGTLADRGLTKSLAGRAGAMLVAHVVILAAGGLWLAGFVGVGSALALGVAPFLVGSVVKIAFGTLAPSVVRAARG